MLTGDTSMTLWLEYHCKLHAILVDYCKMSHHLAQMSKLKARHHSSICLGNVRNPSQAEDTAWYAPVLAWQTAFTPGTHIKVEGKKKPQGCHFTSHMYCPVRVNRYHIYTLITKSLKKIIF